MKKFFTTSSRWEHYQSYTRLPFGREGEFREVKCSCVIVKRKLVRRYVHFGIFSWPIGKEETVLYSVFVHHEFHDGQSGGVAKHDVPRAALEQAIEQCFSKTPRRVWLVLS